MTINELIWSRNNPDFPGVREINAIHRFVAMKTGCKYDKTGAVDIDIFRGVTLDDLLEVKNCGVKTASRIQQFLEPHIDRWNNEHLQLLEAMSQFC